MKPYLVFNDGHSDPRLWGAMGSDRPPTSSPPVTSLQGGIEFRIYNNASAASVSALFPFIGFHDLSGTCAPPWHKLLLWMSRQQGVPNLRVSRRNMR